MKAISPMIATVILIALTVGVAGIISTFLMSTTKTQTEETRETSDKLAKCGDIVLAIDEVKTNSALNPVNVTLTYLSGKENIYNFSAFIIDSGTRISSSTSLTPVYNETNPLKPGNIAVWSISTSGLSGSLFSVRIVGLCQKNYQVSATCKSGNSCMS